MWKWSSKCMLRYAFCVGWLCNTCHALCTVSGISKLKSLKRVLEYSQTLGVQFNHLCQQHSLTHFSGLLCFWIGLNTNVSYDIYTQLVLDCALDSFVLMFLLHKNLTFLIALTLLRCLIHLKADYIYILKESL